jgi:hypothetical protein
MKHQGTCREMAIGLQVCAAKQLDMQRNAVQELISNHSLSLERCIAIHIPCDARDGG